MYKLLESGFEFEAFSKILACLAKIYKRNRTLLYATKYIKNKRITFLTYMYIYLIQIDQIIYITNYIHILLVKQINFIFTHVAV